MGVLDVCPFEITIITIVFEDETARCEMQFFRVRLGVVKPDLANLPQGDTRGNARAYWYAVFVFITPVRKHTRRIRKAPKVGHAFIRPNITVSDTPALDLVASVVIRLSTHRSQQHRH